MSKTGKIHGLAWTLFITILAIVLFLVSPVDADVVSKEVAYGGTVSANEGLIRVELKNDNISFDGMKHLPSFISNGEAYLEPRGTRKNCISDLVIYLNDAEGSEILKYVTPGYGIKNNKKVSAEGKKGAVYIKLKAKKDAPAAVKSKIPALNREMKSRPIEFTITAPDLSKCAVEIEKKANGSVKAVYVVLNGNKYRLSKKDYTVETAEGGALVICGHGSFTGRYVDGQAQPSDPDDNKDDDFISTAKDTGLRRIIAGLNVNLLKTSGILGEIKDGRNVAVSSYSIENALGMTANGAKGDTLKELEDGLFGGTGVKDFNKLITEYNDHIATLSGNGFETNLANGIWLNGLKINDDFKKDVEGYKAGVKDDPFNEGTAGEINGFVSDNTRGMIDKIIDETNDDMAMILVNALYLQGVWDEDFSADKIIEDQVFTDYEGNEQRVTMLEDNEFSNYFRYKGADGIIKNLKDGKGRFIAILPKKETSLQDFISGMDEDIMAQIEDGVVRKCELVTRFPEFEYEYDTELGDAMSELGVNRSFAKNADFSQLLAPGQVDVPLYIDKILHKTHVKVDREGAKAAAATAVIVNKATSCGPDDTLYKTVIFERPFVFMLTDDNNVPLFLGTVSKVK